MKQEDKDLLIKDLCARLPYGVHIHSNCPFDQDNVSPLYSLRECKGKIRINDAYYIDEVKLYLFPRSSMTVKQRKEYDDLCEHILDDLGYPASFDTADSLDYLNKHNIDYRGLIPKGIALDATGLNIY